MPRHKRQKIDRESTAAYSASQPLFDTLCDATKKLGDQEAHLASARRVVQSLHVKIANDSKHLSPERHQHYMDATVKAWHAATESYCSIFEQLVSITAADPSEGKEKGRRHEEFVSLLQTARRAEETAKKFDTARYSSDEGSESDSDEDAEPLPHTNGSGKRSMTGAEDSNDSDMSTETAIPTVPSGAEHLPQPQKRAGLTDDTRYDKTGTSVLWKNGVLKVPESSLTAEEKRAWNVIKLRQKHKQTRSKQVERKKKAHQQQKDTTAESKAPAQEIEYEDVSAEVEARLKAKAEQKSAQKAKKAEKKRKRESTDSTTFAAVDSAFTNPADEAEEDPLTTLEKSLQDKPAKKKARQSRDAEADTKAVDVGSGPPNKARQAKRKKSLEGDAGGKGGEGSKKRKKSNGS